MKQLLVGVVLAVGSLLLAFYAAPWRGTLTPRELPPELADEPDAFADHLAGHLDHPGPAGPLGQDLAEPGRCQLDPGHRDERLLTSGHGVPLG